ncbi:MAG: hypothetical protein COT73_11565 [Bdellovibrio sp. CG10_big_fil_rev_8_21_14_0_10_47_8]|nr:MAG: hypothetical protein COT73_11565 [Bdellovibrio sp. CG10_big_fil_rev_8_21_14_0_10_47_8]
MKTQRSKFYRFLVSLTVILSLLGCSNIFKDASKQDSDDALYEDALKLMNAQDWDEALEKMDSLSSSYQTRTDVLETWAGIYAGKCGLDFITYFDNLGSASLTGSTIFEYFMNAFTGVIVNPAACYSAQLKIEAISTSSAARTSGQNLFMAILGMVKIGAYLRDAADIDGTGNLGDGTIDAGYSSCTTIPDASVKQVITGLGLIFDNLTALTNAVSGSSITDALDDIDTVCGASCQKTDPALISAADVTLFRQILATGPSNPNAGQDLGIDDACMTVIPLCCP